MAVSPFAEPAEPVLLPQAKEYGLRCGHEQHEHRNGPVIRYPSRADRDSGNGVRVSATPRQSIRDRAALAAASYDREADEDIAPRLVEDAGIALAPDDEPLGLQPHERLRRQAAIERAAREESQ